MEKNSDVGETLIASKLYRKYSDCNLSLEGLKMLARRGLCRGYPKSMVEYCLETVTKKNVAVIYITETMHWTKKGSFLMQSLGRL